MATWLEVQERVRRDFVLDIDNEHEFALTVPVQTSQGQRAQRVMARRIDLGGQEIIHIRSAFAEDGDFDARSALADSFQFPIGSVALHGRFYVLIEKERLEDVSVDGIVFLLVHIANQADILERQKGQDLF